MNELCQIGIPTERLGTVIMLWDSYQQPCKMLIGPARTQGLSIVELRHTVLAAEIVKTIPGCLVRIVDQSDK